MRGTIIRKMDMDFEQIWPQFQDLIDELYSGMCFFEGYIPNTQVNDLTFPFAELTNSSLSHTYEFSTWSNETTKAEWEKTYSPAEYLEFFRTGKILMLHFNYERNIDGLSVKMKLILWHAHDGNGKTVEIICDRNAIINSKNIKLSVKKAIAEIRRIMYLFDGNALFIGPDTLDYPESPNDYPSLWIKING